MILKNRFSTLELDETLPDYVSLYENLESINRRKYIIRNHLSLKLLLKLLRDKYENILSFKHRPVSFYVIKVSDKVFVELYSYNWDHSLSNDYCYLVYQNKEDVLPVIKDIYKYVIKVIESKKDNSKPALNIIRQRGNGLITERFELEQQEFSYLNYNEDFEDVSKEIIESLNKQKKGIYLFHGIPGSGKTSYIRYLTTKVKRPFIYIPPHMSHYMSDPNTISFFQDNSGSVIIIEDAESVIKDRSISDNSGVSNLLNITDGLLSDVLGISVICTFNSDLKNIDKALLRKGRVKVKYDFKKLSLDRVKNHIPDATKEMSLAEIFHREDESFEIEEKKIGF